jgi:hypothetical protein
MQVPSAAVAASWTSRPPAWQLSRPPAWPGIGGFFRGRPSSPLRFGCLFVLSCSHSSACTQPVCSQLTTCQCINGRRIFCERGTAQAVESGKEFSGQPSGFAISPRGSYASPSCGIMSHAAKGAGSCAHSRALGPCCNSYWVEGCML